ncbi:MAG: tRNA1(Val) (adenine(37)-N6)-methyltransferase [Nitrospirae bacterium]|nr:tRNA1(Val) (adenine(37)-N6)-methyltransferase [Nitrospirota bacterium]
MTTLDFLRDIKVHQSRNGYRFSIDALLLASFAERPVVRKIADFGAGSGIIGLLLARKYPGARVMLIELQDNLARLAERNVALNGLEDRVRVIRTDIKELSYYNGFGASALRPLSFDLVVSNPPYRRMKSGLINPDDEKAIARHEILLSMNDLVKSGSSFLQHHGRLCMIHLPERLAEIITVMTDNGLEVKRVRSVHSTITADAKMLLIEAAKGGRAGMKIEKPLIIYNEDGSYTDEMKGHYGCGRSGA